MLRVSHFFAVVSILCLLSGCGEDTAPVVEVEPPEEEEEERCTDECVLDTAVCVGGGGRSICVQGSEGCTIEVEVACAEGAACDAGLCVVTLPEVPCEQADLGAPCEVGEGVCRAAGAIVCRDDIALCSATPGEAGEEVCNGLDDDCDGGVDEDLGQGEACAAGVGQCAQAGQMVCEAGQMVCGAVAGAPSAELCNGGLDDDCDGVPDNGCAGCGSLAFGFFEEVDQSDRLAVAHTDDGLAVLTVDRNEEVPRLRVLVLNAEGQEQGAWFVPGSEGAIAGVPGADVVVLGVSSEGASVRRATAEDGEVVWSEDLMEPLGEGARPVLAVGEGLVVAAGGSQVEARGSADGGLLWRVTVDAAVNAVAILPGGDVIFVGASEAGIALGRLERASGEAVWSELLPGEGDEAFGVSAGGGSVAVAGRRGGAAWVASVGAEDGALGQEFVLEGAGEGAGATSIGVDPEGRWIVAGQIVEDGEPHAFMAALDLASEAPLWSATWRLAQADAVSVGQKGDSAVVGTAVQEGRVSSWVRGFHPACDNGERATRVKVYILAGQSNMDGHGRVVNLPPSLQASQPEVGFFWAEEGVLGELRPASRAGGRFGPEVSMGRDLVDGQPGEHVMLYKYAIGGTNLHTQWNPGGRVGDPGAGPLYNTLILNFHAAMAAARAAGLEPVVSGMAWMQGESDGNNVANADAYTANLTRFIGRVRDDFEAPEMPFVIGKIFAPTVQQRDRIRAAQERVAVDVHNTHIVGTDDLPLVDSIHYNAPGQLVLGSRFASALLHHQPEPIPPPPEPPTPVEPTEVVDEASDYEEVYTLPIPISANWATPGDVPYSLDRSGDLGQVDIERVAWFLELRPVLGEIQWLWVSMEAFSDQIGDIGVPVDAFFDEQVSGLRVRSNVEGVEAGDSGSGNIEFWSHCYATGEDGFYNSDDEPNQMGDCYGSMQIHREGVPLMCFNRWSNGNAGLDLGIGPSPFEHPDWTFSATSGQWGARVLRIFIKAR